MSLARLFRTAGFASLLSLSLAACGFQPLHGPTASGGNLSDVMKSVDIALIPGRVGQRIRNELIFVKTGGGADVGGSVYRLDIAVKEELRNTFVTNTGDPQGAIVEVNAEFTLTRLADNKKVFTGRAAGRAAYDKADALERNKGLVTELQSGSVFADVRAKLDAENRAARTISETIRLRLSAYLSGNA